MYTICRRIPNWTECFTSFQAIQWNLQASQSFSPHRSQFSRVQHTKRQPELPHPIAVTTLCFTPTEQEEIWATGKNREVRPETLGSQCCCLLLKLQHRQTDRNLTSGASRPHSQHSPPKHNNKLYSTHQREGGQRGGLFPDGWWEEDFRNVTKTKMRVIRWDFSSIQKEEMHSLNLPVEREWTVQRADHATAMWLFM